MQGIKTLVVKAIAARAARCMADASRRFVRADADGKEPALAELEFYRWLLHACRDCLNGS